MKFDLYAQMRHDIVRAAERCGIDTSGRQSADIVDEMSARIINLEAELADARVQLQALVRQILDAKPPASSPDPAAER